MKSRPAALRLFCFMFFCTALMFVCSQAVGQSPELVRHYTFQDVTPESPVVKNLAAVDGTPVMTYHADTPFTVVDGDSPGTKAVRLDAGYFDADAFSEGPAKKAFTVTQRVRVMGPGTLTGNGGALGGTLFGMGDGYWSGMRYTLDGNHWRSAFGLGRPQPSSAIHAEVRQPWPLGVWMHLAAAWDGEFMTVYWNGVPQGRQAFRGDFTPANWGFRVGYNNAGVGSVKMDVQEVRVYDGALPPAEVLRQAWRVKDALSPEMTAVYAQLTDAVTAEKWADAAALTEKLTGMAEDASLKAAFALMQAEVLAAGLRSERGLVLFAKIAEDKSGAYPETARDYALRRCVPNDEKTPLVLGMVELYARIRNTPEIAKTLTETQEKAVEKCMALAVWRSGNYPNITKFAGYAMCVRDLIAKRHVRDYRAEEQAEVDAERARMNAGESPWAPVEMKNPLEENFKPTVGIYVAPDGKAENPGTKDAPLGTLMQARDAVRKLRAEHDGLLKGGVAVIVRGGAYEMLEPLSLTAEDSGTADAPVAYTAAKGEKPVFSGSKTLHGFKPVTDEAVLKRLPAESRGKVVQVDVTACGVNVEKLPPVKPRGFGANGPGAAPWVDVYADGKPLELARYPNKPQGIIDEKSAFIRTGEILSEHKDGSEARTPGVFRMTDARFKRWGQADAVWFFGYWKHLWAATSVQVEKMNADTGEVTVITGENPYGYVPDAPFYAFNLLEEIDVPGEWFLDRKTGVLYVWPPEGADAENLTLQMTVMDRPFIGAKDVSHTTFVGLTFQNGCATGADIQGGERFWLAGCTFQRFGVWGVSLSGTRHGVLACDIFQLGGGGVHLRGGDVRTLTYGDCFVENCHIMGLTRVDNVYGPAVDADGCGNRIAHNLMHDSPAHGMRMGGFDQTVEFNEIHSVVYESDDQSGIDMFGNPTLRGNVIRYNYWHHIGSGRSVAGQAGIRLDDMISGVLMYGNVFYRASGGHFGGIQIHGGKDNISDNNLFLDCKYAFSFNPWGEDRWQESLTAGGFADIVKHSGADITTELFLSRYPDLAEITENANRNFVLRNTAVGCGAFARNEYGQNVVLNNVMLPWEDIRFNELGRPVIPYDWDVYRMNGMRPLPGEKMGLYVDPGLRPRVEKAPVTRRYVVE